VSLHNILIETAAFIWGLPMVFLLFFCHIFFTVKLKFPQRYILKSLKALTSASSGKKGRLSGISALCTTLGATIGTGNVVGVSLAVMVGGAGAVFWCWLTGVLGMATRYAEVYISLNYRTKDGKGGAMYILKNKLNMPKTAVFFALMGCFSAIFGGNMVQSHSAASIANKAFGVPNILVAVVLASVTALVVFYGIRCAGLVNSIIVPSMTLIYTTCSLIIIIINIEYLLPALSLIIKSAFSKTAVFGGMAGGGFILAARVGAAKGLFSNEAGLGAAPIIESASTETPTRQALISMSGPFFDTVILCAITGLLLVTSIIKNPSAYIGMTGAIVTEKMFSALPYGSYILAFCLILFVFSTLTGYGVVGVRCAEFISKGAGQLYKKLWIIAIFLGAIFSTTQVFALTEIANALMALPNIFVLLVFSNKIKFKM